LPNKGAPVVVLQDRHHVLREDMRDFPKHESGANWGAGQFRAV